MNLTAHIVVTDADAAAAWYADAFGASERGRVPLPSGGAMTVELAIGDSSLHVGSEFADAEIQTDDADELWARALGAGAEVRHDLADQFWGERLGQLLDPFGHRWNIAQRVRDVTPEELAAGAAKAFGSG
jgi:PhnB protein